MPISKSVAISVDLRPTRSPRCPKRAPPKGRAIKPTRKVNNARIVPTVGTDSGKKTLGKTRVASVPYRKKAYHSIAVPIVLEKMTGPIFCVETVLSVAMFSSSTNMQILPYNSVRTGNIPDATVQCVSTVSYTHLRAHETRH